MDSLAALRHDLVVYRRLAGARIRGQMQYKTSFALLLIGNFLLHSMEFAAIFILFRHFEAMGGWEVGEIAFLYGLSATSFGIANIVASGFDHFSVSIVRGEFDRVLIRPAGAVVQVLTADVRLHQVGRILQGLIAFAIAGRLIDVPWTMGRVAYLPVILLSAAVLFTALFALEATLCFWTAEAVEVVNAFTYGGTTLAQYPMHIYDGWLQRLFLWCIPLGFVIFEPAVYLLDKPDPLGLPSIAHFLAPVAAAVFAIVAGWLWRIGVRHYRSTGS